MEKMNAKVKNVKLFLSEDNANVQITLDKEFKGFKRNENDEMVEAIVNTISVPRGALTRQLCEANENIAMLRACSAAAFGQKEFAIVLMGATLTIERELHAAGEVIEGRDGALERDQYFTNIVDITLTNFAQKAIDNALVLSL